MSEKNCLQEIMKPDYYHKGNLDVFTYMEANFTKEEVSAFYIGNILKYLTRYKQKNGYEDLVKASTYMEALLQLNKDNWNPKINS